MSRTRKVLTTQFKQECVNLVVNQGDGVAQAASAMNVGLSSIQRWVAQYSQEIKGITPQARAITPEQQRIPVRTRERKCKSIKRTIRGKPIWQLDNGI